MKVHCGETIFFRIVILDFLQNHFLYLVLCTSNTKFIGIIFFLQSKDVFGKFFYWKCFIFLVPTFQIWEDCSFKSAVRFLSHPQEIQRGTHINYVECTQHQANFCLHSTRKLQYTIIRIMIPQAQSMKIPIFVFLLIK